MTILMFKRMAIECQLLSAIFYENARIMRDMGYPQASTLAARKASNYASAARENLFAEMGQHKVTGE